MRKFLDTILTYGRMIRFSHSIFALPFAISGVLLASVYHPLTISKILWILAAMVCARSAAMGMNRIVDRQIDQQNSRTSQREIPQGMISPSKAALFVLISSALFILSAFQLNLACGLLSFPVLILFFFYPYTKRFTWATHLALGLCLGLAPPGAWLALAGSLQGPIILLGLGVLFWVAGFDIIYACQDIDIDHTQGLFSIPKRFGLAKGLSMAMVFHGISLGLLIWVGISFKLNIFYFVGCGLIAIVMLYQHYLVSPQDLSKVQKAFNANGWISVLYMAATWMGMK